MAAKAASGLPRVQSLDMMRGWIILIMIFANFEFLDIPWYMMHYYFKDPDAFSGVTYVDYVFSMFLLMVGISIPLAFRKYEENWHGRLQATGHILLRGVSMLFIGLLLVNRPNLELMGDWSFMNRWWALLGIAPVEAARACWQLVAVTGVLLLFNQTSSDQPARRRLAQGMRIAGGLILGYYMIVYVQPGPPAADPAGWLPCRLARCVFLNEGNWFHGQWWEIIGVIGWAYMVGGLLYLLLRRHAELIYLGLVLLAVGAVAEKLGRFNQVPLLSQYASFLLYLPMIVMLGVGLGAAMFGAAGNVRASYGILIRFALVLAALTAITSPWAGLACPVENPSQESIYKFMFSVDKERGTLGWMFSTGFFAALLWMALYGICDVKKWDNAVFRFIKNLGSVPLTAYIWQFWVFAFLDATGILSFRWNAKYVNSFTSMLIGVTVTVFVCWIAVFCKKQKFTLKL